MKKCKDCYHYKICENNLIQQGIDPTSVVLAGTVDDSADGCPNFREVSCIIECPCKIHDIVYVKMQSGRCAKATVVSYKYSNVLGFCALLNSDEFAYEAEMIPFSEFGKSVFLTRDEVNEAIRRIEND